MEKYSQLVEIKRDIEDQLRKTFARILEKDSFGSRFLVFDVDELLSLEIYPHSKLDDIQERILREDFGCGITKDTPGMDYIYLYIGKTNAKKVFDSIDFILGMSKREYAVWKRLR